MSRIRSSGLLACLAVIIAAPAHGQASYTAAPELSAASMLAGKVAVRLDPLEAAYQDFEATGAARVIRPDREGGYLQFPFGYERPVIRCPRLNACMIALEPGERLTDEPLAGDTERWIIDTSVMGSGEQSLLVIIKPVDCGLSTNLLVPTSRRVYEMSLASDRCSSRGEPETYTRRVTFWYPDDMRIAREAERERLAGTPDLRTLNRAYRLDRGSWWSSLRGRSYPWTPREVFDDGTRTFIVLPEQAGNAEMPILYALEGGEQQVLNYALRGDTIVADRVLRRAALVVGSGGAERRLEIENRSPARREEGGV
jgi:P-type conjugative transfer protein TrbG